MANANKPFGFRPVRYRNGSPWNGQTQLYAFAASRAGDAFKGDIVQFDATARSTTPSDVYAPGIPCILAPTAGITTNSFRGVITGFVPEPEFNQNMRASLGLMYRVASTARYAWVCDDTSVVYEAQEAASSLSSGVITAVNRTADIDYTAGNVTTGVSQSRVSGTWQTAAVRPWRCLRYTQRPDNFNFLGTLGVNATLANAKLDLLMANSDLANLNQGA
jgi:hypothetical protein